MEGAMTPRELVAVWRTRADGYVGGEWGPAIASTYRGCATELEAALAEAGWQRIEDRREFVVPMEFWGSAPKPPHPYDIRMDWHAGDGSFLRIMHASPLGPKELVAWGFTHVRSIEDPQPPPHARRVPPLGESDA